MFCASSAIDRSLDEPTIRMPAGPVAEKETDAPPEADSLASAVNGRNKAKRAGARLVTFMTTSLSNTNATQIYRDFNAYQALAWKSPFHRGNGLFTHQ